MALARFLSVLLAHSIRSLAKRFSLFKPYRGDPTRSLQAESGEDSNWKRLEDLLRGSEERYRLLAENVRDVIWVRDLTGRPFYISPSVTRLRGYSVEEAMTHTLEDLLTPASLDIARKILAEALAETMGQQDVDRSRTLELEIICKDGSTVWTESNMIFLRDTDHRPVGILGVTRDTTERKRLEEQLRQSQKMEAIGRLAGGIAHDFNNLLTVITGRGSFLLSQLRSHNPLRRHVELIHETAYRAGALTRQLLAFSRKQSDEPPLADPNVILGNMTPMLRRLVSEAIELAVIPELELGQVRVHPGQLTQVIMNLVVNACDAMPQGGRLTIETANVELDRASARQRGTARPGRYMILTVTDTGHGMDAETQAHLFEPFFTTKAPGEGTGLGLTIVYGIVTQSGGHIEVESAPGRGTTFRIYLPRVEETIARPEVTTSPGSLPRGSETVLLVEDERGVRELAQEVLQAYGYTVLPARDGNEALAIGERSPRPIRLLLTDVVMPQMGGCELAQRLTLLYPEMKVLYMSGYVGDALVNHGAPPDTMFLQKPFALDALLYKVREVLDAPRAELQCDG